MQVDLDGALRQPEAPTNFLVGNTLSEHQDYLSLSLGQQEILINWAHLFWNGEMAHLDILRAPK